jgi:hypothetical protein
MEATALACGREGSGGGFTAAGGQRAKRVFSFLILILIVIVIVIAGGARTGQAEALRREAHHFSGPSSGRDYDYDYDYDYENRGNSPSLAK